MAKYSRPHTPSLLRDKSFDAMTNFSFESIIKEAEEKCPDLLDVLVSVCVSEKKISRGIDQRIPAIGTIVGMLLHQHNRELNLVQRVNTILLAAGHAEKKVRQITKLYIRHSDISNDMPRTSSSLLCLGTVSLNEALSLLRDDNVMVMFADGLVFSNNRSLSPRR